MLDFLHYLFSSAAEFAGMAIIASLIMWLGARA